MKKIVIDLGHVDFSSGAVGNGFREDFLNNSIGVYAQSELVRNGLDVVITKGTLQNRVNIANSINADLFVSIHNNSGGGDGTEVLYTSESGRELAQTILNEIVQASLNNSRGVKQRKDLYVLNRSEMTSCLVECGFIDTDDIKALDTEEERKQFGIAIAKGILKYLKLEYKENEILTPSIPDGFEPVQYMIFNPDVARWGAYEHWTKYGYKEGRKYK